MERYQTTQRKGEIGKKCSFRASTDEAKNCYRFDNFLVVSNKKLSMTKHLVCKSSYRLQMVKNKVVDNKVVFLFKRETTLVVDDKHENCFIAPHFSPICE